MPCAEAPATCARPPASCVPAEGDACAAPTSGVHGCFHVTPSAVSRQPVSVSRPLPRGTPVRTTCAGGRLGTAIQAGKLKRCRGERVQLPWWVVCWRAATWLRRWASRKACRGWPGPAAARTHPTGAPPPASASPPVSQRPCAQRFRRLRQRTAQSLLRTFMALSVGLLICTSTDAGSPATHMATTPSQVAPAPRAFAFSCMPSAADSLGGGCLEWHGGAHATDQGIPWSGCR